MPLPQRSSHYTPNDTPPTKDSHTHETPPTDEFQKILAHFHQSEQARLSEAKTRLCTAILPALRTHRVANIEAAYSGYGDSGGIDGIQYQDEAGVRVDRTSLPAPVIEQPENVLYEFLPSGFEINDGGQGTLTLEVQAGKITILMNSADRVVPVRFIGEQHVLEDLGRIPTVADWLGRIQPEAWMPGKGREHVGE